MNNGLDDLVHDVSAEPINVALAVLQNITMNFADERKIGKGGFGIVYKVKIKFRLQSNILFLTAKQNY